MRTLAAVAAVACTLMLVATATAAPRPGTTVERRVDSSAPDARLVRESFVRLYDPLPASVGAHPAACD